MNWNALLADPKLLLAELRAGKIRCCDCRLPAIEITVHVVGCIRAARERRHGLLLGS